jgi:hypothetical protein
MFNTSPKMLNLTATVIASRLKLNAQPTANGIAENQQELLHQLQYAQ